MRKRLFSAGSLRGLFPSRAEQGFTLIELILVIVIIGIAYAIVVPAVGNRLDGNDPKRTAAQLRTALERLRLRALTEGAEQRLIIDPEQNRYWQESGRQRAPQTGDRAGEPDPEEEGQPAASDEEVQLSATSLWVREEGEVEFRLYPDGTNSGGEITIEQQRGANVLVYTITLNPLLGTATVRYAEE